MDKIGDKFGAISVEECLKKCYDAGFRVMDFNFCDQCRPGMPIAQDNWYEYICKIKELADEIGIEFSQTHPHIYDPNDPFVTNHEWEAELVRRSMICSGILGTKWAVMHPLHIMKDGYSRSDYIKMNIDYFAPILETAKKYGYGLAFENMCQFGPDYVFGCNGEDLVELVDTFNDKAVGVCWDFGHGHISVRNQRVELLKIGKRLKATHVADNHKYFDEHLAPFYGTIDWPLMMRTLKEIEYEGDFTYEIQEFAIPLPYKVRESMLKHIVDIGNYLINLK